MATLSDKVAIITGAGRYRSIGRSTALMLAEAGANVVVTGTGRPPDTYPDDEKAIGWRDIDSVADEVRALGRKCLALVADMANPAQARGVIDRSVVEMGRIDILVNNAAAGRGSDRVPVTELDDADWHRVLDVKLNGSFYASKAAAKHMVRQGEGGSIIMISSITGKLHSAHTAAYTVANIGLLGLTGCLSKELGQYNINVNSICPGIIDTARMDGLGRGKQWRNAEQSVPMGRAGQPQDVAAMILFLCSKEGRWTSGQSINVDGGQVSSH